MKIAALHVSRLRSYGRRNENTIIRRLTLRDPDALPERPPRPRRLQKRKPS